MTSSLLELRKNKAVKKRKYSPFYSYTEFVAFCPNCKNMETIWLNDDDNSLQSERKYHQSEGHIFHDCGSAKPCKLYGLH
jgi:hypothetical protein